MRISDWSSDVCSSDLQNLVMPDVAECDLYPLWQRLKALNMATPNIGLLTDMICCPGLDFCGLANASSISVYHDIYDRFESLDDQYDVGPIRITMSGCMNGCGHPSVAIGRASCRESVCQYV